MLLLPDAVTQLGIFGSSGMSSRNLSSSNLNFSVLHFRCLSDILATSCTNEAQIQLLHSLEG